MYKFSDRIYLWEPNSESDRPLIGLIIGDSCSILFDAGNSEKHANQVIDDIKKNKLKEPKLVLISHAHYDHWFGLSQYNYLSIASKKMIEKAKEMKSLSWDSDSLHKRVEKGLEDESIEKFLNIEYGFREKNIELKIPDIGFDKTFEFDLGNLNCIFDNVGGDHSDDSSILYVKEEEILFLGDILYLKNVDEKRFNEIKEVLFKYKVKYYIDSHYREILNQEKIEKYLNQLQDYMNKQNS